MIKAAALLAAGIIFIIIEFFIPAFGLVGLVGAGTVIASIVTAFMISNTMGAVLIIIAAIMIPLLIALFFKVFPHTFFGKRLILGKTFGKEEGFTAGAGDMSSILGQSGTAFTDLRPSGMIIIENKRINAVSNGEYIEKDSKIIVKKVDGNRIVVSKED